MGQPQLRAGLEPPATGQRVEVATLAPRRRRVRQHPGCRCAQGIQWADEVVGAEDRSHCLGMIDRAVFGQPIDTLAATTGGERHMADPDRFVIADLDEVAHVVELTRRV